jgi:hypothetical protein
MLIRRDPSVVHFAFPSGGRATRDFILHSAFFLLPSLRPPVAARSPRNLQFEI